MLTIILLAAITIGCIIWSCKSDWDVQDVAIAFAIVMCLSLSIVLLTLCNRGKRFEYAKQEYLNLKTQVEEYNSLPDSCKLVTFEYDIRKDVLAMNNKISRHAVMHKSIWKGPWFSEEIGQLPKLHIVAKTNNDIIQQETEK